MDKFFRDVKQLPATRNFSLQFKLRFLQTFYSNFTSYHRDFHTRVMSEENEKIYINFVLRNSSIQNIYYRNEQ